MGWREGKGMNHGVEVDIPGVVVKETSLNRMETWESCY